MWIRVQNEDILIEAKLIYINKGLRGTSKCAIVGKITGNTVEENMITLGVYKNIDETKLVFNEIQSKLYSGENFYIMP